MKTVLLTSAAAAFLVFAAAPASAAQMAPRTHVVPAAYTYVAGHAYRSPFSFPRGVSYGTGYHGPDTITGGPVGGLPSRN